MSELIVEGLVAGYGRIEALHGVDLAVSGAEAVTLIGTNGAGKTTLLKTVAGLIRPWRGRIRWQGEDITGWPAERRVRAGLALVPEGRRVFAGLSVADNLLLGGYARRGKGALVEVYDLFPRLRERRAQPAGTLSGGEQQMLAIGRALMPRPRLLLLDEPSLGLAPLLSREIFDVIRRINADGVSVLLVEQNARRALALATRGYVLETGRLVASGPSAGLAADPRVRRAYLGLDGARRGAAT